MDIKKIVRNPNTYLWLGSVVVVIGMILVLTHKKKSVAVIPGVTEVPATSAAAPTKAKASNSASKNVTITNFDSVWDYKLENGVWYTKKKTSSTWLDMKKSLSAADYTASINKLTSFLNK